MHAFPTHLYHGAYDNTILLAYIIKRPHTCSNAVLDELAACQVFQHQAPVPVIVAAGEHHRFCFFISSNRLVCYDGMYNVTCDIASSSRQQRTIGWIGMVDQGASSAPRPVHPTWRQNAVTEQHDQLRCFCVVSALQV